MDMDVSEQDSNLIIPKALVFVDARILDHPLHFLSSLNAQVYEGIRVPDFVQLDVLRQDSPVGFVVYQNLVSLAHTLIIATSRFSRAIANGVLSSWLNSRLQGR